jgi:hypothetical protein
LFFRIIPKGSTNNESLNSGIIQTHGSAKKDSTEQNLQLANSKDDHNRAKTPVEILEELDWCLIQLENMQSYKTISDIASTKVGLFFY